MTERGPRPQRKRRLLASPSASAAQPAIRTSRRAIGIVVTFLPFPIARLLPPD